MDGYGKPGYNREEFEREMDAELDAVSSLDRAYQPDAEDAQRAAASVSDGLDGLFRRLGPPTNDTEK
ncbi:hypothetical protein [Streptomyces sp. NPDC055105]|uniref:hypothetical protein n=1 Tax=Streptomyces sp. NPDC055105 TaxID=3365719 RepID=UPI0037D67858